MSDVLDRAELMERIDNDLEFLGETFGLYKKDCPELVSQMREALSRQDSGALAAAAHTLKGLVSNFAAHTVVEAARKLEVMAEKSEFSDPGEALAALEHECNRLKDILEGILQQG